MRIPSILPGQFTKITQIYGGSVMGASRVLPVRAGEIELLVETAVVAGTEPTSRLGDAGDQVIDAFGRARDAVVEIASSAAEAITRLGQRAARPQQVEVEFGLKFSGQGNVIVAAASGEASLLVRVTYDASQAGGAAGQQTQA
jgi:hypothetical protein